MKKFGKTVVFSFVLLTGIFLISLILSQKCLIVRKRLILGWMASTMY